jgi:putative hydrolase of the HAD superfamily
MLKPLVVFDGDDTLWLVEHLYDEARNDARRIVTSAGLDGVRWEELERQIDVENVARYGVSAARFPTSCVQAYEAACAENGIDPDRGISDAVRRAAQAVFERPAPVVPSATAVLTALQGSARLALLTKGEPWVQKRRIADSGLEPFFEQVVVCDSKGPDEFAMVLTQCGGDPAASWSVGNSIASDINPALSIGMSAIWIDAHVWEHERRDMNPRAGRLVVAASIHEVPAIILGDGHGRGKP